MGVNGVNNSVLTSMSIILPCMSAKKIDIHVNSIDMHVSKNAAGSIKLSHMDVIGFDMGVNGANHSF